MVLAFPLLLIGGLLVLLDVGPPIFFWQERLGWKGRSFLIYKFRTLSAPFDSAGNPSFGDRQPSAIGRFLRATRIDELPQLLNVLFGDMSLIGPRPLLPEDQPANTSIRLSVRPGISGWAQVNGAKLVTKDEKEKLDEWYVRNASLCDGLADHHDDARGGAEGPCVHARNAWLIPSRCKARMSAWRQTLKQTMRAGTRPEGLEWQVRLGLQSQTCLKTSTDICERLELVGASKRLDRSWSSYLSTRSLTVGGRSVRSTVSAGTLMMTGFGDNLMTKTEGDGMTSGRRRRRWSRAEKERIVAAAMEPGAVASAVAREAGIQASQLFRWRQQLHGCTAVCLVNPRGPARPCAAQIHGVPPSDATGRH